MTAPDGCGALWKLMSGGLELPPGRVERFGLEEISSSRSASVFGSIVAWTLSAFKTRGVHIRTDFKLDRDAIRRIGKVVTVYSTRPLVNGTAALLELLSRLLLLLIFLALSATPRHRKVVMERMRCTLQTHVRSVRRLALTAEGDDHGAGSDQPDLLPRNLNVLLVGGAAVGKSTLSRAMQRMAKRAGRLDDLVIGESHGGALPQLTPFQQLRLIVIVWEAAQGTALPAYVANFTQQLERKSTAWGQRLSRSFSKGNTPSEPASAPHCAGGSGAAAGETAAAGTSASGRRPTSPPPASSSAAAAEAEGATATASAKPRVLVLCNKTDAMPCPMPQIQGLRSEQAFIAVSAERGTNLGHLWGMVAPLLPTSAALAAEEGAAPPAVEPERTGLRSRSRR